MPDGMIARTASTERTVAERPTFIVTFDPMDWLRRAALAGYRHTVVIDEDGNRWLGRAEPCCYVWEDGNYPGEGDLWKSLGSCEEEWAASRQAINRAILNTDFADWYVYADGKRLFTRGSQPMPPGARLPTEEDRS